MENKWLLSPQRKLTKAEKILMWEKPESHIESEAEYRICAEVTRNRHNEEMKINNILLEGDAGSGKTQLALRIDESASMAAFGRLEAAKLAAIALYEFCHASGIPIIIYGDTADRSPLEQMSVYAYVDFESRDPDDKYVLAQIQGRSNNRDGMALRIIAERLSKEPQNTKLIISISDGQPKALPNYSGDFAVQDMKDTLQEYRRKGIVFLALVKIISRYI